MDTSVYADRVLDYGDKACSDIVTAIEDALREMKAGQKLLVIASDPSVSLDIIAWCRTTGNPLLRRPSGPSERKFVIQKGA